MRSAGGGSVGRSRVAGRWIGRRDRLRFDRRRPAEGRVIENRKIFGDSEAGRRIKVLDLGDAAPSMRVGLDHAGVDRKGLASHDPFLQAARDHRLEQLAKQPPRCLPRLGRTKSVSDATQLPDIRTNLGANLRGAGTRSFDPVDHIGLAGRRKNMEA
jgi:hypothetical protein